MANPLQARYSFRHGVVHAAEDRMARYVVRLSMALGDLRIAAHHATRARQSSAERLYFVRLTASHLRELILIMDPPDTNVVPQLDEFLASLPRGTKPSRTEIRRSHARALRMLDRPMARGRPEITTSKGRRRRPTLRDDIKELRNRFFHYGHDQPGDDAIRAAMASLRGEATGYVIRQKTMRALYADDIGTKLAHPFDVAFAHDMHSKVVELLGPAGLFVQQVEAAWLHAHRSDVIVRSPGSSPRTLREALSE